jgi:guanylate kinase
VTDRADAHPAVDPSARSRLTVLAGPTAVGKGTIAADIRRNHQEV